MGRRSPFRRPLATQMVDDFLFLSNECYSRYRALARWLFYEPSENVSLSAQIQMHFIALACISTNICQSANAKSWWNNNKEWCVYRINECYCQ